ncbi:unnamed protein product [Larinioides sclopetarius]|uniref:Uncharacterized protein n=1 Tax=Larinioides sclopetarius TaxID=280406 RepID=A0AAV1ZJM4_9ARAC
METPGALKSGDSSMSKYRALQPLQCFLLCIMNSKKVHKSP